jgi:hypothetical protein
MRATGINKFAIRHLGWAHLFAGAATQAAIQVLNGRFIQL